MFEGFIRGVTIVVIITSHHVLRCAAHINKSKQLLMGELQESQRKITQMIRRLMVLNNVTLNNSEGGGEKLGKKERSERLSMVICVVTPQGFKSL